MADLLRQLEEAFDLVEVELGLRFGDDPPFEVDAPDDDETQARIVDPTLM